MPADKKEEDFYQFDPERTHQGLALVISNFTVGRRKRKGAEADLKYMKKTFKRLGFKVDCHENVKGSELVSILNKCSQQMLTSYDCFVFAISSHGMEIVQEDKSGNSVHQHAIEMFDGVYIYTKGILDYFTDGKCKALKNKPKLFFIQACRIPETKSTQDHYKAGVGFDSGISTHNKKGGQDQRTTRDKTDFEGFSGDTETDSDRESDVSDTDVEEDESSLSDIEPTATGHGDGKEPWQNLEKRQTEILKKLKKMEKGQTEILKKLKRVENGQTKILKRQKRMENKVWHLGREYMAAANQNKEPNALAAANQNEEEPSPQATANQNEEEPSPQTTASQNEEEPSPQTTANQNVEPSPQTTANQNKESSLQASGNEDSKSHSAADENKNASGVTGDIEDDIDAKRRRLYESRGSGDDIDPPRGQRIYPPAPAPVEFTLVPCHNDMLIMFASPQGHYAFRNKTDGSYMLQLLYKCVEKYYANGGLAQNQTNFLDVLRDVTTQMSEMKFMGSKEYTIVPCIVHKLRKDVIFTQGKSMGSTKFTFKLSEIISTLGMSFFTWSNKN
nr:uncharacterized protein LOC105339898 isoform X2 [Crassostrea gigas]